MARAGTVRGLAAFGLLAAGVAAGALAERLVTRRLRETGEVVGVEAERGRSITVTADDGTQLHVVVDDGPTGSSPTVIFSHGYALSLDSWPGQRGPVSDVARTVLWDQRGHGRSQKGPPGTDIDRLGRDLGCVIDAVAPTGPIVLVGHSMGGMTIMALADQRPELFGDRIRGVALLATSAGGIADVDRGLPRPIARLAHAVAPSIGSTVEGGGPIADLLERALRSSSDLGLLITRAYAFGSTVPPDGTRLVADLISGTPVEVLADLLPALEGHEKEHALHVLERTDLLVMVGDADLLTPVGHSMEIVRHVPSGDLVVLIGDLGAGKTTLTRGIGEGLGVRGPITSPTFVIARQHPSLTGGPALLHVDAYRVGSANEIDDLDLGVDDAVTVVEWGAGRVEHLAENRLEVGLVGADTRIATVTAVGERWGDLDLDAALSPGGG